MSETWVHGSAFAPRLYGAAHLLPVDGIAETVLHGLHEGFGVKYAMRNERQNIFQATVPVVGGSELTEVRVEYWSQAADLDAVSVHSGSTLVVATKVLRITEESGLVGRFRVVTVADIDRVVDRGLSLELTFTTAGPGLRAGQLAFYGAAAVFRDAGRG